MNTVNQRGLVLIELLIVIAILSLLFQLLLPAIQSARESARQTSCQNNLRQLAVACIAHLGTHGHFPTGGWTSAWAGDPDRGYGQRQPGGWGYSILPYLEEQELHDRGKGLPDSDRQKAAAQVYGTVVPIFTCTSRRLPQAFPVGYTRRIRNADMKDLIALDKVARGDYAANMGTIQPPRDFAIGPKTYKEGDGWPEGTDPRASWVASDNNGTIFQRSEVTPAMVIDGLSRTFMIGEKLVPEYSKDSSSHCDDQSYVVGFEYDNNRGCNIEMPPTPDGAVTKIIVVNPPTRYSEDPKTLWRFGSSHPTVFHMANCDGSVHRIQFSVDINVFSAMGTRNGGENPQLNE